MRYKRIGQAAVLLVVALMVLLPSKANAASLTYVSHTGTISNPGAAVNGVVTSPPAVLNQTASLVLGGVVPNENIVLRIRTPATQSFDVELLSSTGTLLQLYTPVGSSAVTDRTVTFVAGTTQIRVTATNSQLEIFEVYQGTYGEPPDTTPPPVPTGLNATPGDGQVSLSWSAVSAPDLDGYNVYRDGVKLTSTPISATSYTVTGLTNGTEYDFTVSSEDEDGNESAQSTSVSTTPLDTGPPGVPTGLSATAGNGEVQLFWSPVSAPDLEGYNVYIDGSKVTVSPVTSTMYTATGLSNGTEYDFSITAVDETGNESAQSTIATATPYDDTPPAAPTGLTALAGNQSAALTWSSVSGVSGYHVYRDNVRVTTTAIVGTSHTVTGLINGYEYEFQVTAVSDYGVESARSAAVQVIPTQSFSVNLVPNGTSIIVQVSGGEGPYTVDWGDGSDTFDGTQYVITGLTLDTTYTVTVTDSAADAYTETIGTGTNVGYIPPAMPDPTTLYQGMLDGFGTAGTIGVGVIAAAVALGVLVILGIWGWRLSKKWLARST